jgi:hypothetical protein
MRNNYAAIIGNYCFFLLAVASTTSCNRHLIPDRSQFLKDGDTPPTVELSYYRSVQERPRQDSSLAVAMCISGGGSRAANFGMGVMLGLEELELDNGENVLNQVDYLSTVSGGGFAAGAYISALYDHDYYGRKEPFSLRGCFENQVRECLKHSYTGVLLRANFNPRLLFSYVDDGDALEKAIDDIVLGYKRRKQSAGKKQARSMLLGDLFIHRDSVHLPVRYPMLFANSSVLSTMAIFPFTPDVLDCHMISGYTHQMKTIRKDQLDHFRIPLSVGIKASGSFPVLISNSTLRSNYHPERRFLHLIDGAISDNIGWYTAMEVLKQDRSPRKVLLIVDAEAGGNRFTFSKREGAKFWLNVFGKLPSSGLEARRVFLEKDLYEIGARFGITPVFLSFNGLIRGNEAPVREKIDLKIEQSRMIRLLQTDMDSLADEDLQILYELLTHIGTKYSITGMEQELLLLAGQKIVRMQRSEILSAIK